MKSETDIALERLAKASEQLTVTAKELVVVLEKHNQILQAMVPINHNFYRDVENTPSMTAKDLVDQYESKKR